MNKKQVIQITESQLRQIVNESIKKVIYNEGLGNKIKNAFKSQKNDYREYYSSGWDLELEKKKEEIQKKVEEIYKSEYLDYGCKDSEYSKQNLYQAKSDIYEYLVGYLHPANYPKDNQKNAEFSAFVIALQKFASRLMDKYDIDVNDVENFRTYTSSNPFKKYLK